MHGYFFLQRPVLPRPVASVGVLTQHRVLAPPPPTHRQLHWPQKVRGVTKSVELHHILLEKQVKLDRGEV